MEWGPPGYGQTLLSLSLKVRSDNLRPRRPCPQLTGPALSPLARPANIRLWAEDPSAVDLTYGGQMGSASTSGAPRLLAVSVGRPTNHQWNDTTVRTAIWKAPVPGRRDVKRLNIVGDEQADKVGHGGEHRAVLVYQIDSYQYWSTYFSRDDFAYGQFGENFTVTGLADSEVHIGDRYLVGTTVFEVTQPRVTCYRVGIRMGVPTMAALLVAHRRPGFYMRVLKEGQVGAGDPIEHIHRPRDSLSVADIDALLYLPERSPEDLTRAVAIDALSEGWRQSLRELLQRATAAGGVGTAPIGWVGFRPSAVVDISSETADVRSMTIAAADGHSAMPSFLPGQFLTIRIPSGPGGALSVRNYSLSSSPADPSYRISVKREEFGEASEWLHTALAAGQTLDIAAPRGDFVLRNGDGPVLLISAGIGVTPLLAMLHALAGQPQPRAVTWIQVVRSPAQRPFADEIRSLLARLPQSRAHTFYTADAAAKPTAGDADEVVHYGRPDAPALCAVTLPPGVDAYLCGPGDFMKAMSETLVECGVERSRIYSESFGPSAAPSGGSRAPHVPDGEPGTGPNVTFSRSGLTTPFADRFANLLELAEACDIPVHWSCRTGVCNSCITATVAGDVKYQPQPLDAPGDGEVLLCCATPTTDLVLDI